jgi:excisionase family DNA binding protein
MYFLRPGASRGFSIHIVFHLDRSVKLCYKRAVSPKQYTTREVAEIAGVSRQTLQAWIAERRVKAPAVIKAAGVRLWTDAELARVLKVKHRNYPKKPKGKKR